MTSGCSHGAEMLPFRPWERPVCVYSPPPSLTFTPPHPVSCRGLILLPAFQEFSLATQRPTQPCLSHAPVSAG